MSSDAFLLEEHACYEAGTCLEFHFFDSVCAFLNVSSLSQVYAAMKALQLRREKAARKYQRRKFERML